MVASKQIGTWTRTALADRNGSFPETDDRFNTHVGKSWHDVRLARAVATEPSMGVHDATQDVPQHGDARERRDNRETYASVVGIRGWLRGGFIRAVGFGGVREGVVDRPS